MNTILSPRELQVARRLVDGMRIGDIARAFDLSAKTASTYKTRIREKLFPNGNPNDSELRVSMAQYIESLTARPLVPSGGATDLAPDLLVPGFSAEATK